jgi:1-acyl-sn-glycerol-3-phosphate acyltransferase
MPAPRGLLTNRGFLSLLVVRATGFFTQSLLRVSILTLLLTAADARTDPAGFPGHLIVLHALGMLLFGALGGAIADRLRRDHVVQRVKLMEVFLAIAMGWLLVQGHFAGLYVCVFLLGVRDGLTDPAINAAIPDYVRKTRLAQANGVLLACVIGATLVAVAAILELADAGERSRLVLAGLAVGSSLLGLAGAHFMPAIPAAASSVGDIPAPRASPGDCFRSLGLDRYTLLAGIGIAWFWMHVSVYFAYLPEYAQTNAGNGLTPGNLAGAMAAGSVIGALLLGPLSGRRVEVGLVPLGAIGLAASGLYLYLAAPGFGHAADPGLGIGDIASLLCLGLMGLSSSFYVLPLYAVLQLRLARRHAGRAFGAVVIATGLVSSLGLLLAAWLQGEGLSPSAILLAGSVIQAVAAVYVFTVIPEFLIRLLMWLVTHTLYRVHSSGLGNVPAEGPALLVCNHVSFMDALVIGGCIRRPVRFVMHKYIFEIPVINQLFRWFKTIPIASAKDDPQTLTIAMDRVAAELEAGRVVCIFPEGRLTRDGEIGEFRNGALRIVERTPVPVIPMGLSGLWGSFFSNCGGPAMKHRPRWPFYRVDLTVGPPLQPEGLTNTELKAEVQRLRGPVG